jgi:hypothetical protein
LRNKPQDTHRIRIFSAAPSGGDKTIRSETQRFAKAYRGFAPASTNLRRFVSPCCFNQKQRAPEWVLFLAKNAQDTLRVRVFSAAPSGSDKTIRSETQQYANPIAALRLLQRT